MNFPSLAPGDVIVWNGTLEKAAHDAQVRSAPKVEVEECHKPRMKVCDGRNRPADHSIQRRTSDNVARKGTRLGDWLAGTA
jgi:hypothetical protein